jgi:hypothetical protein
MGTSIGILENVAESKSAQGLWVRLGLWLWLYGDGGGKAA